MMEAARPLRLDIVRAMLDPAVRAELDEAHRLTHPKPVPPALGLTFRQRQLLDWIEAYQARHGVMPSFDDMAAGVGLASKSGIHRLIAALEERGHLMRLPNRARSIALTGGQVS